jgi:hypothetical protein
MPTNPARLTKLITARRFEDVGRRLQEASAADLAAIPTPALLEYLDSLPDAARRTIPEDLLQDLRRRRPTEADLAISVAGRMILVGLAEDARLVIDGALEAAEQKESLALRWIVHLLGLGIPAEARVQLATVSARHLCLLSVERAAAQIDLEEQKFDAVVARLEPIVRRHPEMTSFQVLIDRARTCSSIVARFAAARLVPHAAPDFAAFAVNLDEHPERFRRLKAQLPPDRPPLIRIPGVKGRYLPDAVAAQVAGLQAPMQKGSLGCFLAHVAAWERFRASAFDHALFVEDDVMVAIDLPPSMAALDLPSDYDICFAGYGTEPPPPTVPTGFLHVVPVAVTVAAKSHGLSTPGTYGYFLSRRGADKLLGKVARDGYAGDIDWRLVAYSIGAADHDRLPPDHLASMHLRRQRAYLETCPSITGYCLHPALFTPGHIGSTRLADNIQR